jgi:uncharacterized protein (TIGR03435 family)
MWNVGFIGGQLLHVWTVRVVLRGEEVLSLVREVNIAIGLAGLFLFAPNPAGGQAPAKLEFEVASVKPMPQSATFIPKSGGPGTSDPGQITWSGATLKWLLWTAYDVTTYQISGPAWLDSEQYTIVAKVPEGATKEQVDLMWQNLLKDRFGVVVHHEPRVFQAEEMTLTKGGSKLKETGQGASDSLLDRYLPAPGWLAAGDRGETRRLLGRAQTPQQVASILAQVAGHPVIDKSGLTGKYDFNEEFYTNQTPAPGDGNGVYAIADALGLKLTKITVQLDVIVVDRAEKIPTDN